MQFSKERATYLRVESVGLVVALACVCIRFIHVVIFFSIWFLSQTILKCFCYDNKCTAEKEKCAFVSLFRNVEEF